MQEEISPDEWNTIRSIGQRRFWHEGDNLTTRTDFFLIGQAILIEAFISAHTLPLRGMEICAFGLVSSLAWLLLAARNEWHIKFISAVVESPEIAGGVTAAKFAKAILETRKEQPKWLRWAKGVFLFGRAIPFVCFDAWVALALQQWTPVWFVTTVTAAVALVAMWLLRKWPRTDVDDRVKKLLCDVGLRNEAV